MKHLYSNILTLAMMAITLLTIGCSSDDGIPSETTGTAISLAASVDGLETRAGITGGIDYSVLAQADNGTDTYGFGVFSSSTSKGFTSWLSNEHVIYSGSRPASNPDDYYVYPGNWTYANTKDWTDDAQISFYAYAPYVPEGSGTTGITNMNVSTPSIDYAIATTPDQCVDLLWGVNAATGKPWTDATLDETHGPVLFIFHHALAAIGFHVQAIVDKDNDTSDFTDKSADMLAAGGNYKITVKSLQLEGLFYPNATLNLQNTTANAPLWTNYGTLTSRTLTVGNALINTQFRHPETATTQAILENDELPGVTQTPLQPLIIPNATNKEQCFFVIPNAATGQTYTATLNWCLSGKALDDTYITEDRTSKVTISDLALQAGIKYYLNFVIGLKTLQLNVTAED